MLRLTILHQQEAGAGAAADAEVVRELRQIRDRVNHILDLVTTECKVRRGLVLSYPVNSDFIYPCLFRWRLIRATMMTLVTVSRRFPRRR